MSSMCYYKCSNPKCTAQFSLRYNFPIWREDTPEGCRRIPVGSYGEKFVLGYKSQKACSSCRKIFEIQEKKQEEKTPQKKRRRFLWWVEKPKEEPKISPEPEKETIECPVCHAKDRFIEKGDTCTKCNSGTVELDDDIGTICF